MFLPAGHHYLTHYHPSKMEIPLCVLIIHLDSCSCSSKAYRGLHTCTNRLQHICSLISFLLC